LFANLRENRAFSACESVERQRSLRERIDALAEEELKSGLS
jgi:hypothetical protein